MALTKDLILEKIARAIKSNSQSNKSGKSRTLKPHKIKESHTYRATSTTSEKALKSIFKDMRDKNPSHPWFKTEKK